MGREVIVLMLFVLVEVPLFGFVPADVSPNVVKELKEKRVANVTQVEEKEEENTVTIGGHTYKLSPSVDQERKVVVRDEKERIRRNYRAVRTKGSFDRLRLILGLMILLISFLLFSWLYFESLRKSGKSGFSLLELLIVLSIFSVLLVFLGNFFVAVRPFFSELTRKLNDVDRARRIQVYVTKVLSSACVDHTHDLTFGVGGREVVFPRCTVIDGKRIFIGQGRIFFDGGKLFTDPFNTGNIHLLVDEISSWQAIKIGDKIQIQYQLESGDIYRFQVALVTKD